MHPDDQILQFPRPRTPEQIIVVTFDDHMMLVQPDDHLNPGFTVERLQKLYGPDVDVEIKGVHRCHDLEEYENDMREPAGLDEHPWCDR